MDFFEDYQRRYIPEDYTGAPLNIVRHPLYTDILIPLDPILNGSSIESLSEYCFQKFNQVMEEKTDFPPHFFVRFLVTNKNTDKDFYENYTLLAREIHLKLQRAAFMMTHKYTHLDTKPEICWYPHSGGFCDNAVHCIVIIAHHRPSTAT